MPRWGWTPPTHCLLTILFIALFFDTYSLYFTFHFISLHISLFVALFGWPSPFCTGELSDMPQSHQDGVNSIYCMVRPRSSMCDMSIHFLAHTINNIYVWNSKQNSLVKWITIYLFKCYLIGLWKKM